MKLYQLINTSTGETKNFIMKSSLGYYIGVNSAQIDVAILNSRPIKKRTGDIYKIEYKDVDIGIKIEDI